MQVAGKKFKLLTPPLSSFGEERVTKRISELPA
jgi:hypothetical protein